MRCARLKTGFMLLFCLVLSACDTSSGPNPRSALSGYLDAALKGRYEESYSYLSAEDRCSVPLRQRSLPRICPIV